ncbi:hypothetical protein [Massilibacteroides sp.]|uniref:hypothetical protein n=1 Tax=Massilibacteroides sp. TaxID=2034766 RepID=UPI002624DF12|nr:hypothetical protein [Massilibacteroides sp.]MDD4516801.1 hypothetical protein [Massilibacteroides sp.]
MDYHQNNRIFCLTPQDAYNKLGLPIPNNCMVNNNSPYELDHTGARHTTSANIFFFAFLQKIDYHVIQGLSLFYV